MFTKNMVVSDRLDAFQYKSISQNFKKYIHYNHTRKRLCEKTVAALLFTMHAN